MKRIVLTAGIFAFLTTVTVAQNKQLSMEDAFLNVRTTLAPQNLKQLKWMKGAGHLSYVDQRNGEEILMDKPSTGGKEQEILKLSTLNTAVKGFDASLTLTRFPMVEWVTADRFAFNILDKQLVYDLKTGKVALLRERKLPVGAENMDGEATQNRIAFTIKNNLYVTDGVQEKQVTNDTDANILNGKSVHREEFGITKGTFWSPKGNLLAFYRMDQRMVADYPVIDWTSRPAKNINIKYPMAGEKSHEVTLGVYNVATGSTVFLQTGEPKEQYLTNIAWSPDEAHVYIAVLNRDQNHMKLNSYNAQTGAFENTLFEESDPKFTEPLNPVVFVKGNGNQFIWQSQRDGYNHLYLYQKDGKLIRQLTKGNWIVTAFLGFDKTGTKAFFNSTIESPITRNLCSVDLRNGKVQRITQGTGTHTVILNDDATMAIDNFSSVTTPREVAVYSTTGKKISTLLNAANPLADYKLGEMNIFTIKSESGEDLYCRLYKPTNFDAGKKYPVIVYQYGGPHAQLINNTWNGGSGDLWFQYLAERGYVVFTLDTRGSYNRGRAFEQATFRQLGEMEMHDQLKGVDYLKSLPYVDGNRMGLMGWSFGGFMTTNIMTRYPDVFKAAVAGGPVIDWSFYEIMYTERYMDTPQQNPEGYAKSNLLNNVGNLKGKLMLIHGTQDATVVWQHSIMFLKAAVDKGKQVDYFVYPGYEHNVGGKDRVHLFNKITNYFMDNL